MNEVISLYELASNAFVKHVNLLCGYTHTEAIPPTLWQSLLKASLKTDRILSARHLFFSWPLQSLSLIGCKELKERHAVMLAHCLEAGCNKLREVNLTGCNIGVHGTTSLLMLIAGRPLPKVTEYCTNKNTTTDTTKDGNSYLPSRLSITADCYVNVDNYSLFLDILNTHCCTLHDFNVSYFNAIELGHDRIAEVLQMLRTFQALSVIGLDFEMNGFDFEINGFPYWKKRTSQSFEVRILKWYGAFSNLQYLNLSKNFFFPGALILILKNISACLTHLLLNNALMKKICFDEMAQLFCIQKLEHLELRDNRLDFQCSPGLMKFLRNCSATLSFLNLEYNNFKDESTIIQLLDRPFTLQTLRIGYNKFTPDGEKLISQKDKLGAIIIEGRFPAIEFPSLDMLSYV